MNKFAYIALDGPDCCGKSTISKLLCEYYKENFPDYKVVSFISPGETEIGNKIRNLIFDNRDKLHPMAEISLFFADMYQTERDVVKPNYFKDNTIIIADRWASSTFVYQYFAKNPENGKFHNEIIDKLCNMFLNPSHLVYLNVDDNVLYQRLAEKKNKNVYDESVMKDISLYKKGYKKFAKKYHRQSITINCDSKSEQDIVKEIATKVI